MSSRLLYDGGPAFPSGDGMHNERCFGMTLRDYFAAHADQPGISECYLLALEQGESPLPDGKPYESYASRVNAWWDTLTLTRRLSLYALVRWRTADALLAARSGEASDA